MKKSLAIVAMAIAAVTSPASAQSNWPTKPIRIIVPFPAGQASDTIARLVGERMSKGLGQPVVVENVPGAGGNVGSDRGAKAEPDGYTLTMATAALPISALVYKKLPFNASRDFAPITQMTITPLVLITAPGNPANSVKDIVDEARRNPGKVTFASSGTGTSHHLSGELLKALAGIDVLHVPYRGSAPAHIDLMGGLVNIMFDNIVPVTPHIKSGKLKALAVTTKTRAATLPDVPTMAESGYPNFEAVAWFGLLAPAATPRPIIDRLNREAVAALNAPDIKAKLTDMGASVVANSPAEFAQFFASEFAKWKPIVERAKIELE